MISKEDVTERVVCGPDPAPYFEKLQEYRDAGFDHIYLHQVGPDQAGFMRFFERELRDHVLTPA